MVPEREETSESSEIKKKDGEEKQKKELSKKTFCSVRHLHRRG